VTARKRIGLREVRALKPGQTIWDSALTGFGARRQRGPTVAYVVFYRTAEGRQRWHTIGRHGALTPDLARQHAKLILGQVVMGADPAREKQAKRSAETVSELCDLYLSDAKEGRLLTRQRRPKKASTVAIDAIRISRHIKPLLGGLKVASVQQADVERFLHQVASGESAAMAKRGTAGSRSRARGGMGAASRTLGLLGAIFTFAVKNRIRADNPTRGVQRPADGKRDRRLSDEEYTALGRAVRQAEENYVWPGSTAAVRFLALTGWRSGEALNLRWQDINLVRRTAILPDSKTGRSMRPLARAVCAALGNRRDSELVFPPARGKGPAKGFTERFRNLAKFGELPNDVTPHVLRHSFASIAADLGFSEPTIAALVGHAGRTVTSRYIHSADSVLLAAADSVADKIAELMGELKGSPSADQLG
jgi:integrase